MAKIKLTWSRSLAVAASATILALLTSVGPAEQPKVRDAQLAVPADVLVAMLPDEEQERNEERERDAEREHAERERVEEREHAEREAAAQRERLLHAMERRRDELMDHVAELKHQLAEAEDGPAAELRRKLEMAMDAVTVVQREMEAVRHGERPQHEAEGREHPEEILHVLMREREELMELGRNLRRELGELEGAGRSDAVREVARKIEGVTREFQEVEARIAEIQEDLQRGERPQPEGPPREEIERRMHHLRVAIENLHAAGLHEPAEQLAREGERLVHQAGAPPHEHPDGPVQDLQRQVQEMRGQMEEMRRALQMLMERDRR